jgi:DNA primase
MNIPVSVLDGIKDNIQLSEIIGEKVQLSKKGKVLKGLCPFHDDKHPSFVVDDSRARFRCWGCGQSGDVFDWLRKTEHDHFPGAVRKLAARVGISIPEAESDYGTADKSLFRTLLAAQKLYAGGLDRNPAAKEYLHSRGINEQTCREWGLGVVSSGIAPTMLKHFAAGELLDTGIIARADDGREYERLRQRITIPVYTINGRITGFSGRKIHAWDRSPKYLNPPQTALFNKSRLLFGLNKASSAIRQTGTAIIVEGYFDVIALHQEGETRAVAGMGTAITPEQLTLICKMANRLYFCMDSDKGGRAGIRQLLPRLLQVISDRHDIYFLFMAEGMDPDDFIRSNGLAPWQEALGAAVPLSSLLLQYVTHNYQLDTIELKKKAAIRAEEVCRSIKGAPYLRQLLVDAFRRECGITLNLEEKL